MKNILFALVFLTVSHVHARELISSGHLNLYQSSPEINVSQYRNVMVGISWGSIMCRQKQEAVIASYFQAGGSWYLQNNCSVYCGVRAMYGRSVTYQPLGNFIKLSAEPPPIVGSAGCQGSVEYQVFGDR